MEIVEKRANKDYPVEGIQAGQKYFWWRERGRIHRSPVRPILFRTNRRHYVEDILDHFDNGRICLQEVKEYLGVLESRLLDSLSKYRNRPIPQQSITVLEPKLNALQGVQDELQPLDEDDLSTNPHVVEMLRTLIESL